MKIIIISLLLASSTLAYASEKRAWNSTNYPGLFNPFFVTNIDQIPNSGEVQKKLWSGYYWPHRFGGIGFRWQDARDFRYPQASTNPNNYQTKTINELLQMSRSEIMSLSPAEKYDIFMNRFDYPTVRYERARTSPSNPLWFGICEGWTAVSINHEEPSDIEVEMVNGIKLPFSSSDIKALIAFAASQYNPRVRSSIGARCNQNSSGEDCWDTNPASFHLILANRIGRERKAFAMDLEEGVEVWNQPVHSFKSHIKSKRGIGPNAARGTVKELKVRTTVWYIQESLPQMNQRNAPIIKNKVFSYILELNSSNEIIGGEWLSNDRPDFLWIPKGPNYQAYGYYKNLELLYNLSTQ